MSHQPTFSILFRVPWTYLIFPSPWLILCYFLYMTILSFLSSSFKNTLTCVKFNSCGGGSVALSRSPFEDSDLFSEPLDVVSADGPQLVPVLAAALERAKLPWPRSWLLPRGSPCQMNDQWRETEAQFETGTTLKAIWASDSPICLCDVFLWLQHNPAFFPFSP